MSVTSLHNVAPRLAVARDIERWNIWCAGDDGGIKDGDHWAETVNARHDLAEHAGCADLRDPRCEGIIDHYRIVQRILYGCNRGQIHTIESWKCRRCKAARSSHR